MRLFDPLTTIKGIGLKRSSVFTELGITNIGELLFYFPRTYNNYPKVKYEIDSLSEEPVALCGRLSKRPVNRFTKNITITTAYLLTGNIQIDLVWFNSPYVPKMVNPNVSYVYYGRLKEQGGKIKMEQPLIYTIDKYNEMTISPQPIYPLTKGLKNTTVISAVKSVLDALSPTDFDEYLDEDFLRKYNFKDIFSSIYNMHFPSDMQTLKQARRRLVFDEFYFFYRNIKLNKKVAETIKNSFVLNKHKIYDRVKNNLPYELTNGQNEAISEILSDFRGEYITQRLIQGDVGSGKTIIAFLSMLVCLENGYKAAVMAPTEVLARQHYQTFSKLLYDYKLDEFEVVLLTSKISLKERNQIKEKLKDNKPLFIVGTHSIIQEGIEIKDLSLAIIDEQHRFGVKQRDDLAKKGINPFYLVMSATPIPRSLAKIIYGDMNITLITDVPNKRLPIKNCIIHDNLRPDAFKFIFKEINAGHQAYIICPLVDKSEKTEAANVTDYFEKLKGIIPPNVKIGVLHGKMKSDEKNEIMERFSNGEIHILVSTTVVEVGIDVPNATVIMIENANRFGLAQLHQLRGRVGRGDSQSYCIFINDKKEENERLNIINSSNDGFFIANEDLKLRGPGELNGLRQSGALGFRLGDIYTDNDLLVLAQNKCLEITEDNDSFYDYIRAWDSWYNI